MTERKLLGVTEIKKDERGCLVYRCFAYAESMQDAVVVSNAEMGCDAHHCGYTITAGEVRPIDGNRGMFEITVHVEKKKITAEQLVRDILEAAIKEGLITCDRDPQTFTAGDLVVPANIVAEATTLHITPAPSRHTPND